MRVWRVEMGLMDFLKGTQGRKKCASCEKETDELPISKKFDGKVRLFCSKECERQYRINIRKDARKPQQTRSSMPW
jgi:hypothetical protein